MTPSDGAIDHGVAHVQIIRNGIEDLPENIGLHPMAKTLEHGAPVAGRRWQTPQQLSQVSTSLGDILTTLFTAVMSHYMGVAGWLLALLRERFSKVAWALLLFPAVWVLGEWWRGWFMTGFPWFSLGYSQIDMRLAGWRRCRVSMG